MLEIQKYLENTNGDFVGLEKELGIKANFHPSDERVILNYDQILSNKLNEIVRDCRALTLNRHDYSIIAKGFRRFLNWGEGTRDEMNRFNWNDCLATSKEDGSYINLFYWQNKWHLQTRNSYGDGYVNNSIYTWREIFEMGLDPNKLEPVEGRNYVFELCSLYNQVVRIYKEPTCYLLTIFDGLTEWTHEAVESFSREFSIKRPFSILCRDPFEVSSAVAEQVKKTPDFEGWVLRDVENNRFKFKSEKYLLLHSLSNNGNVASISNIVDIIINNEMDEILTYFPYIEEEYLRIKRIIDNIITNLDNAFYTYTNISSRKKFAEKIKFIPFNNVLFSLFGEEYNDKSVKNVLYSNPNKIKEYIKNLT